MGSNKNFEYLGSGFQLQLLNQLIIDKEFARTIIDVLDVNYFENKLIFFPRQYRAPKYAGAGEPPRRPE